MKLSLSWLKDYLDIDLSVEEVCEILTNIGLEVDGYEKFESIRGGLKGIVVGKVLTCCEHPNSDHLHITTVDLGDGNPTQIICGAPNVAAGQTVVVATDGTTLYKGDEAFEIKKSKIRGEESNGMICAEDEIGIGTDHEGIIVLPDTIKAGTPASEYYNVTTDYTIEIDITPNRIDGASIVGVARDITAYLKQRMEIDYHLPSVAAFHPDSHKDKISIKVERPEACRRYCGLTIEGIEVKPSPEWLRTRLQSIGLRPINNIVDITNFILFELGQPLHSFDRDMISGDMVVVKSFPTGTPFVTLDGIERKLHEDDLMICDAKEPMCIAGIFGGLKSGITEKTKSVFLESASFDPIFVRKSARRFGLSTDASFRFERGTDPNICEYALKRAALLVKEVAGGEISSDIIDIYPTHFDDFEVNVKYSHIDRLIGKAIEHDKIKNILKALEIKIIKEEGDELLLHVPPYRVDVTREADVIEDILRIYGLNNIEIPQKVNTSLSYSEKPDSHTLRNMIGDMLAANGFNEIMNNSLTRAAYYDGLESYKPENLVMIVNPLSSDLNAMRQSLIFGGLESIAHNINRKNPDMRFFEFGKSYTYTKREGGDPHKQYAEEEKLALFITGNKSKLSWNSPEQKSDFYNLKGYCELILKRLGFELSRMKVTEVKNELFSEGLTYAIDGKEILHFGIVAKEMLKRTEVEQTVYYAEFQWEKMLKLVKNHTSSYTPIPKFPVVKRDLALLIDKKVTFSEVRELAFRTEKELLKDVTLFDVYEGEKLGAGKKSYAVSFTLLDEEKTLTDKIIDKCMNRLMGAYIHQLNATIR